MFKFLVLFVVTAVALFGESEALDRRLSAAIAVRVDAPNLVGYLSIGKERSIDNATFLYVKFALEHYKKLGVRCVVLDLNTPGGEIFAAMKIADLLQKIDTNDNIPVIAFIDNWAISAGAMLAYSCRFIGITKTASMGAAEPVTVGEGGQMESASEKVNSALRSEFSNLASFYNRNPLLAEAMVDKDLILVQREGRIVHLEEETQIQPSDSVITKKGKLLTLNAEQLMEYGVADFLVPPTPLLPISDSELAKGEWPASKCLLFQEPFLAKIPDAKIVSYQDWKVDFFSFLSNPLIASILMMGLVIGGYIELNHPGLLFPGLVAGICLTLILLSSFAAEAANWLELIILFGGIALLLLELFVIPGFGVIGILGIVLILLGLFTLMLPHLGSNGQLFDGNALALAGETILNRLAWLCGSLLLSLLIIGILWHYLSRRSKLFNRFVLKGEQEGFRAVEFNAELIGKTGICLTDLKPSGHVLVEGEDRQALSESGYLTKDTEIIVTGGRGAYLTVVLRRK